MTDVQPEQQHSDAKGEVPEPGPGQCHCHCVHSKPLDQTVPHVLLFYNQRVFALPASEFESKSECLAIWDAYTERMKQNPSEMGIHEHLRRITKELNVKEQHEEEAVSRDASSDGSDTDMPALVDDCELTLVGTQVDHQPVVSATDDEVKNDNYAAADPSSDPVDASPATAAADDQAHTTINKNVKNFALPNILYPELEAYFELCAMVHQSHVMKPEDFVGLNVVRVLTLF